MAGFGPASLPHLALILDSVAAGGSAKAPAPLPSLGLVMYDAGIFCSLSKTLDAVTSSSAGNSVVNGTLTKTLANVTSSSSGTTTVFYGAIESPVPLPHLASLFPTISGIIGQSSVTLEALTALSEGDVPGNEIWPYEYEDKPPRAPLYWPHARNVDWFQTDTVLRDNTGGRTGVVGTTLANMTLSASLNTLSTATLSKTLENLTRSSQGTVDVSGQTAKTLGTLTVSGSAFAVGEFVGTVAKTLGTLTVASSGAGSVIGVTVTTLGNLSSSAIATVTIDGALTKTLQGINAGIGGSVLSGYVAVVNNFLEPLTCSARIGEKFIAAERPAGGWLRKKRKNWYEEMPTPEEVEAEREALGILPKKAQKIVKETVDKATDVTNEKQAALLAAAYLEETQQRNLVDRLREKTAKAKTKWDDDMFTITRALILDELRKKADADELEQLLRQQEHEEVEANEILELWMEQL
jgi:hypothetical protein